MPEMYCPKCGNVEPGGSSYCSKCGTALVEVTTAVTGSTPVVKTSGMATAALVLGLAGLFFGILAVPAIVFGAIGISHTGKDPSLKGRGMAIAGLVLGIMEIVLIIIFVVLIIASVFTISNSNVSFW